MSGRISAVVVRLIVAGLRQYSPGALPADDSVDALLAGETMRFCNDHDPLPLLAQLQARYGDALQINYVQREAGAIVIDFTRTA